MPDAGASQYAVSLPLQQPVYVPARAAPPPREKPEEPKNPPSFGGEQF
jgi:hypothetical protein